ncbi:helix-turn-helix domain-containing protein [Aquabacterium sp. J223]|uniref:helix-turn-helix domain-containing protein n=1 Tax=Aquabacterium sp. J223 TaxID=2898431 RepID=UPI0021ADE56C|nr:helix-turn-helix transcriptional regulator [Aquabacterium sp. J223]UUX97682.1 helix-turn-helix transcriptional regulator [Aquabacterium sp. J223]
MLDSPALAPTRPAALREGAGDLLRHWREQRRLSQLSLALKAEVSPRHLSCLETGRAAPSRAMLMRLATVLEMPLRERNRLLVAAGFAPLYRERPLDDPSLHAARDAVQRLLAAHEPCPALAIDRHWQLLAANAAVAPLLQGVAPALLAPPVNVLRLSLHPDGLAPRILNLGTWRAHLLHRLSQQIDASGDPVLIDLLQELRSLPGPTADDDPPGHDGIAVLLRLQGPDGPLAFLSTTTVFGTPVDITLSELALETFFPADDATARALRHASDRAAAVGG